MYMRLVMAGAGFCLAMSAAAQSVEDVVQEDLRKIAAAAAAQTAIENLDDDTLRLMDQYDTVLKEIEGVRVHNELLRIRIADQERNIASTQEAIENAQGMESRMAPLEQNMIGSLRDFVERDLPFNREERVDRAARLFSNLSNSKLSSAERFRQLLETYKIESDYSKSIEAFDAVVNIDGVDLDVNMLRVGRIALMYQTKDQKRSGAWQQDGNGGGSWVTLDGGYGNAITKGLKIARKQAPIEIMELPVAAPQEAQ